MLSALDSSGMPVATQVLLGDGADERPLRRYGDRSAGVRVLRDAYLRFEVDEGAVNEARKRLGWRVSDTPFPIQREILRLLGFHPDTRLITKFSKNSLKMSEP